MPEGAKLQGWGGVVSSKSCEAPRAYEIEIEIKLGPSETRDATKIIFFFQECRLQ